MLCMIVFKILRKHKITESYLDEVVTMNIFDISQKYQYVM